MRVVLTNLGSTGDIQPFLALAVELREHGHQPVLAASSLFASRAENLGIEFVPVGPSPTPDEIRQLIGAMASTRNPTEQMRRFLTATMPALPQMFRELREACRGADVVVGGATQPAARMVHDVTGIPFASVQLHHFGVVTGHRPPPGLPVPPLPGRLRHTLNRAIWKAVLSYSRGNTAPIINHYRTQEGLTPLVDPLMVDSNSPQLALFAVSRHVVRPGDDWPKRYHLTGYFFLDEAEGWEPDPELVEFLSTGDPPVVISFGSMIHDDPDAITDVLLAAVERTGRRAVIQQGWSGLARRSLPDHVRAIGYVPHRWLFSRAACVVHHGGAGTTAAVFRAGVPSVFVPHLADQPAWAMIARELGCAGSPVPFRRLSADRLAAAIDQVLSDDRYARAAARLGEQIRAEQGVSTARRLIERFASGVATAETA